MKKKILILFTLIYLIFNFTFSAFSASVPNNPKKQTEAGKYLTAYEAYEIWKKSPDKIKIIDSRTQEEYSFIGHAPMAFNVPVELWTKKWNPKKNNYLLEPNPNFVAQVKKRIKPNNTIFIMCRSGSRSAKAANLLFKAGITNIYNIVDGFEGDKIDDNESYFDGKRIKNGWKNSSAPWTYKMDPSLMYMYNP
ncbi:MAG: sulfurtransferase [Deltaproteobacteria bacterium]|nr:sulfurtransferase [Deltaproteobacteria bacterium]